MPEERGLYGRMRVRDQLRYLGELCGRSRADVARRVDTWLDRLGLADRATDRVDALSHGNQQRVQLIAALVDEPELLVLDEPFSGLDPLAMARMSDLLAELAAAGTTILFSSHQLDLVEDLCQDVVVVDHGRVVLQGRLDELRAAAPERYVEVGHRGPPPDWTGLGSVALTSSEPGRDRLRVAGEADLAAVAAVAQSAGELVSFTYEPPTLSELFRRAVEP
jgi:ABC-2 type transport system ATP-binding protein